MTPITSLGWTSFFEDQLSPAERQSDLIRARVAAEHKHRYMLLAESGELSAKLAGKLRHQAIDRAELPAVGDWVVARLRPDDPSAALIQRVLTRKTRFSRKQCGQRHAEQIVAANVDTLFLISSLNQELNVRRLERYLTTAWEGGAVPVILLNKADLHLNPTTEITRIRALTGSVPIHVLSAKDEIGIDALNTYLTAGQTSAMIGSSGVGKSTLINRLLGHERQAVMQIREDDDMGRHTTTSRELFMLPGGGLVIDTPGMREFQLWDADSGLSLAFEQIESTARSCGFRNCTHQGEPRCAIAAELESGRLDRRRYENYLKLQRELEHQATKADPVATRRQRDQRRKRGRRQRKMMKNRTKW